MILPMYCTSHLRRKIARLHEACGCNSNVQLVTADRTQHHRCGRAIRKEGRDGRVQRRGDEEATEVQLRRRSREEEARKKGEIHKESGNESRTGVTSGKATECVLGRRER